MSGLLIRSMCWLLLFGVIAATGCGVPSLVSVEESLEGQLRSTPDAGSPVPDAADPSDEPEAVSAEEPDPATPPPGEEPVDGDGGDAGAGIDGDDGSSSDGDQEDPEMQADDGNPPTAHNQVLGTPMNTALPVTLSATDPDEDPLTYSIVDDPACGVLNGSPPALTYVPGDSYRGFDSFSFQADSSLPGGASNTANVRIWVIDEADLSGQTVSGTLISGDTDVWRFQGQEGQRILIRASRHYPYPSPILSLYPPGGGEPETTTASRRIDWQLRASGEYAVAVENASSPTINYNLNLIILDGQHASLSDLDGGPIASDETLYGQISPTADIDVFTFEGRAGQRVLITRSTCSYNAPTLSLYPPGNGERETSTSGQRLDWNLQTAGRYTIVVELDQSPPWGYNLTLQKF